ncbi:DUF1003 domain-containing protein [Microbacterium imperiale]|uniref:DUF1003 domain-containing protein n=1 Tax=Microbacterium imperiale TaxID=33884 RepID=A0A9W6HEV5_9MICO|nr:DUF1003 domain-containing protein [Microbacterium imperiale]MDS0198802.1 DUF1003 domain-containing protein [Microbacterium imperiale]BFE39670.1 DUF1003 domain-containing protein [Microbacterium imperiale]GLJ79355.1 hypothetical protein GCM10017586_10370 [Microbacterium imperiale]
MARSPKKVSLEAPRGRRSVVLGTRTPQPSRDRFGRFTEWVARAMGTPQFLVMLSLFCLLWIAWNTLAPEQFQFDSADLGFTALTLVLSLQASYAAPLILLAQNRQDDRDRVQIEQDRQRAERNLADTEYLAREVVALRLAISDLTDGLVTKETLRSELRTALERIDADDRPDAR